MNGTALHGGFPKGELERALLAAKRETDFAPVRDQRKNLGDLGAVANLRISVPSLRTCSVPC